jgi:nucleotide-binding universal stress UspA family protein
MFTSILLTTDGSKAAERAAPYAVRLADTFDATLHVLYVVDTDAISYSLGTEQVDRIVAGQFAEMTEVHERAASAIDRIRDYADEAGLEIAPAIEVGDPHTVIVRFAEENDVDLVVMTSQGRGGVRRMVMGSVTERVTRSLEIPVLVVGAKGAPPEGSVEQREPA